MIRIATASRAEREAICLDVSNSRGIPREMVEKDFWVVFVLGRLFADPFLHRALRFKGGTSLSKAYGLIERFSEDLDLILDWRLVDPTVDPLAARSKTGQERFNERLETAAITYIGGELCRRIQSVLGGVCKVRPDAQDGHTLFVEYPRSFPSAYLTPSIRLEIGPLAAWTPFAERAVTSFVAESLPSLGLVPVTVPTITAERRFLEKLTILHHEHHRPVTSPTPARMSRHYYDVFRMSATPVMERALADTEMLAHVVAFKQKFYPRAWAHYELAKPGTLCLSPSDEGQKILAADYRAMRTMIYGDYPAWSMILARLVELERRINGR